MARPRSEDKRNAILTAAIQVFAEQGLAAPTARIAREAGVAEGTLFTYFESKDALLNELYLLIKGELREAMREGFPGKADLRERSRHVWQAYVDWGVANLDKRRVMAQLNVSERVTAEARAEGAAAFEDITAMLREATSQGPLHGQSPMFTGAIMSSLAETTMDFMTREPARAAAYRETGFEAFWNAMTVR